MYLMLEVLPRNAIYREKYVDVSLKKVSYIESIERYFWKVSSTDLLMKETDIIFWTS